MVNQNQFKNPVKIDHKEYVSTLMNNLCTCTKSQIGELIDKQLKRSNSIYSYKEDILLSTIKREKKIGVYDTKPIGDGKDFILTPYGEAPILGIIPCFWVLQDMFKDEYLDIKNVFKGKSPEVMSYSTENITYSFYYMDKDSLGMLAKSIHEADFFQSINEKTRDVKYHLINVYVTDSIEVMDYITEATKNIPCQIALIKYDKTYLEKPEKIAYIVDGKRVK